MMLDYSNLHVRYNYVSRNILQRECYYRKNVFQCLRLNLCPRSYFILKDIQNQVSYFTTQHKRIIFHILIWDQSNLSIAYRKSGYNYSTTVKFYLLFCIREQDYHIVQTILLLKLQYFMMGRDESVTFCYILWESLGFL